MSNNADIFVLIFFVVEVQNIAADWSVDNYLMVGIFMCWKVVYRCFAKSDVVVYNTVYPITFMCMVN